MSMDAGRFNQMTTLNNMRDVKNSGVKAAQTNVAAGNTTVTKQNSESKTKEEFTMSDALKNVRDQKDLKKASEDGGAQNAQGAARKKQADKKKDSKNDSDIRGADNGKFYHVPDTAKAGDILPTEDGGAIVVGEMDGDHSKLTKSQAERFHYLDSPENAKNLNKDTNPAGKAMGAEQTNTKEKRKKLAKELKPGDAKFGDQVERLVLEPTGKVDPRGKIGPAGIKTPKDEKPLNLEDEHADRSMKIGAELQMAKGGGNEAFVA